VFVYKFQLFVVVLHWQTNEGSAAAVGALACRARVPVSTVFN